MQKHTFPIVASALAVVFTLLLTITPSSFARKGFEGGGADQDVIDRIEDAKEQVPDDSGPQSPTSTTATIHGSVFYNDQRTHGLFADRWDTHGKPGQQCLARGIPADCSATKQRLANLRLDRRQQLQIMGSLQGAGLAAAQEQLATIESQIAVEEARLEECSSACGVVNWLAGKYMVVDVIERDEGFPKTDSNCKKEDVLTSATVGFNGLFTATFSTQDACKTDKLDHAAIQLRVRLRFCNASYCFSINKEKNNPYQLSTSRASASNPMTVKAGDNITMSPIYFNTASDPMQPNNDSIAANYYAAIVDTILTLHKESTIPFYKEEFGETQYLFPSNRSRTATALAPTEVAISTFQSQPDKLGGDFAWVDGKTPTHEYGHIVMQRAWDGSYGFDGVGISAGDSEKADSQQIAFKEAWAEFLTHVVFPSTRGCHRPSFDDNAKTPLNGPLGQGTWWRGNIIKALCDWYDNTDDNDQNLAGPGDTFDDSNIYSMWYNLRRMYIDADKYGGKFKNPGLWFCDYVRYYLDVRRSANAVGQASHDTYETKIRDLLYNNNIACFMTPPPGT